jgi:hypothetical protein
MHCDTSASLRLAAALQAARQQGSVADLDRPAWRMNSPLPGHGQTALQPVGKPIGKQGGDG